MFSNKNYWCVFFNIAVAASLFNTVGMIKDDAVMASIFLWIMVAGIAASIVCFLLRNKIKTPPPLPLRNLGDLFFPYTLALSTAMFSIDGVPTTIGYWIAIGFAVVILIANSMPLISKKHPKN